MSAAGDQASPQSERGDGEEEDADDEHPPAPEQVGRPSSEQQQAGEGERVGADHPLQPLLREAEVGLDRGQRDDHDRRVEDHHQEGAAEEGERPPATRIGSSLPAWSRPVVRMARLCVPDEPIRIGGDPKLAPNVLRGPTGGRRATRRSGRRARCGSQEGRVELRAGADLELAIGVAQVHLDRLDRDEERLRDLLVAHPVGCELCHAPLARGERVEPGLEDLSRPRAGGGDLVVRPLGEPECSDLRARSTPSRSRSRASVRWFARRSAAPRSTRARACSSRASEPASSSTASRSSAIPRLAALDETEHAQGGADGVRVTPPSSERELLVGERTRFVVSVEKSKAFGGPAAPGHAAWIVEGDQPNGLADLEQLLDSPLGASGLDAQTAAVEPKPGEVELVERELLGEVTLVDDSRRLVRVPLAPAAHAPGPDVVRPGDEHAVRDAEIDRLPQIRDRRSKIAAMRLTAAAPHQDERDVEDVAAPASLSDRLVEDGNRLVEQPRPG